MDAGKRLCYLQLFYRARKLLFLVNNSECRDSWMLKELKIRIVECSALNGKLYQLMYCHYKGSGNLAEPDIEQTNIQNRGGL